MISFLLKRNLGAPNSFFQAAYSNGTRLVFVLLFCFSAVLIFAQSDTTITIQEKSISVEQILDEISVQSGLDFSFSPKILDTKKKISFQVTKLSLEETLQKLCQQLDIQYTILEEQIIFQKISSTESKKEIFHTLSGFLTDNASGENLIGASIAVLGTSKGVFTNEFGYYALHLAPGDYTLEYAYIGFEPKQITIRIHKNSNTDIALSNQSMALPAIIVEPIAKDSDYKKQLGAMELSPETLNSLPEFGGESGLVKGIQSLPGFKTHSDGSSFFYTRGGDRDQNLIMIDDAPIFNPSHLLGFYSMVLPDFTKKINLYKNDMPTNMGDRLSSIVDIRTNDGNLNKFVLSGAFNPLVNRITFETPIIKKRSALFVSFRRSTYEWLYKRSNPSTDFHFQDFHLKWNIKINKKNRLFLTMIQSGDFFTNAGGAISGIRWGNFAATLRWNRIYGPKLFSNTTFYTGNYVYQINFPPNIWSSALGMLST